MSLRERACQGVRVGVDQESQLAETAVLVVCN